MKPRTVSGLKADLRAANAEARSYLHGMKNLEEQNESLREHLRIVKVELQRKTEQVNGLDHACAILFRSLEQYQQKGNQ